MATIKILSGSFPAQKATMVLDQLMIKTHDKKQKTYAIQRSITSLERLSENKNNVIFNIEMSDGAKFKAEADKKTVHHLTKFVGNSTSPTSGVIVKSQKEAEKENLIAVILLILVGLFIFYRCSGDRPPSLPEPLRQDDAIAIAVTLCESSVKQSLKSPSTADFPFSDHQAAISEDKKTILYTSYVDSQNGFGAMIRTNFACKLQLTGQDPNDVYSWQVQEVTELK